MSTVWSLDTASEMVPDSPIRWSGVRTAVERLGVALEVGSYAPFIYAATEPKASQAVSKAFARVEVSRQGVEGFNHPIAVACRNGRPVVYRLRRVNQKQKEVSRSSD